MNYPNGSSYTNGSWSNQNITFNLTGYSSSRTAYSYERPAGGSSSQWGNRRELANGTLTISGTGRMTNFTKDAPAPWADQADQITTVEVEGTVTSVGATAFKDCTALTTVNIPLSVGYIKTGAFKGCTALTSVTIRDNCRLDMNVFPDTVEVNYAEG